MSTVKIHNIASCTTALGPGNRAAIWFQGCERRCKGCMSPNSRPLDGGATWEVEDLVNTVCSFKDIEGVTVSGGEPFLQSNALFELLSGIRKRRDLGVIIYTGNTIKQLKDMHDNTIDAIIYELADIIIDGEYIDELNDGGSLKGSSNQVVNFITDRYKKYKYLYESNQRNIQIMIQGNESLLIGVPERKTLEEWKKALNEINK